MAMGKHKAGENEKSIDAEIAPADAALGIREMEMQIGMIKKNPKREASAQCRQIGDRHARIIKFAQSYSSVQAEDFAISEIPEQER